MFPLEFKFKYSKKKSAKEETLFLYKDRIFIAVHWLTVLLIASSSFFTGVPNSDIDVWNMTQHCDNEKFNQPLNPVDQKWVIVTVISVSLIIMTLMSIRTLVYGLTSKDLLEMTNYFLGLLLSWDVTYVLQTVISYPVPSFFQNEQLRWLYCCASCHLPKMTKQLRELDLMSRGSFPSFLICASSYATVFLFSLTCYFDEGRRFFAKLLALLVPGGVTLAYAWYFWQNNENHLQDVVGGAIIGSLLAVYIVRDIYQEDTKMNKFTDDFISVLLAREIELAQLRARDDSSRNGDSPNEYTINLYSHEDCTVHNTAILEDSPPPYSSLGISE